MQDPLLMIVRISFQILNSMSTLHKLHQSTYDSLEKAKNSITARVGVFSSVFSPSIDESKGFNIFLDIVGMGFVLAVAPLLNSGMYHCSTFFSVDFPFQYGIYNVDNNS